jgi:hypothetical protein
LEVHGEGCKVSPNEILGRWRWRTDVKVLAATTIYTVETPPVVAPERRELERVLLQNEDTDNSVCVISIVEAGNVLEIYAQILATKAVWYPIQLQLTLFPGEYLRYAFTSCTAADDLKIREAGQVRQMGEWADGIITHAMLERYEGQLAETE